LAAALKAKAVYAPELGIGIAIEVSCLRRGRGVSRSGERYQQFFDGNFDG